MLSNSEMMTPAQARLAAVRNATGTFSTSLLTFPPPALVVEATIARAKSLLAPDQPASAWLKDAEDSDIALFESNSGSISINHDSTIYTDTNLRIPFDDTSFSPSGDDLPTIPTVFKGLAKDWLALKWNASSLAARCKATDVFALDGGPGFARESLHSAVCSMSSYAAYAAVATTTTDTTTTTATADKAALDAVPLYIFDPDIGKRSFADGKLMASEYSVPACFSQDLMESRGAAGMTARPLPTCWLLVGAANSGTPIHNHPMTAAWNTLFSGIKLWVTLPPDAPPSSLLVGDACPNPDDEDLSAAEWFKYWKVNLPEGACVIIQKPGETVFLPASYWHVVLNVCETTALSRSLYLKRDWVALGEQVAESRDCEGFARIWQSER
jgi:hypothetical protein